MGKQDDNPVIKIKDLVSHYGKRQVLTDINLEVRQNEILVIMGSSGSGKSTLLSHLLGLKALSAGSIKIWDKEITSLTKPELYELRKNMGVAFQGGALFSSMSLMENIELPLREHTDLDDNTIRIMSRLKLEMMNLLDFEHLMPAELSGGMLKRAGLARAIVMDPKLLFFDEPSSGLDPVSSVELDMHIKSLRDALNMTVVVITHELESAMSIADRITILHDGKQLVTGNVDEINASDDVRVQNLLNRKPHEHQIDGEQYIKQLTQ